MKQGIFFMSKVSVYYQNRNVEGTFDYMCVVNVGDRTGEDALEYAYFATQNIHGSWSMGSELPDGTVNKDYSGNIESMVELETYEGRQYGHRSSMMGDRFIFDCKVYRVATFGFKELTDPEDFTDTLKNATSEDRIQLSV